MGPDEESVCRNGHVWIRGGLANQGLCTHRFSGHLPLVINRRLFGKNNGVLVHYLGSIEILKTLGHVWKQALRCFIQEL